MVLVRGSLVVVKNLVSIYHSFFTFWIFRPKHTVGPGRYIYSKTSKDNSQMILITSFFKSFEFELNPIPKTDFLKKYFEIIIWILYPYHIPYWQILETSSKNFGGSDCFLENSSVFSIFQLLENSSIQSSFIIFVYRGGRFISARVKPKVLKTAFGWVFQKSI